MTAWVRGVGTSYFGKQTATSSVELGWQALAAALTDATREDDTLPPIDAAYVGTVFGEPGTAVRCLQGVGIGDLPILTLESACASGTAAFHEAVVAVESGRYATVVVLGVEHMSSMFAGPIVPQQSDAEGRSGLAMPAMYALSAARWLAEGRVTTEQLAAVSVKNHRHALGNPQAQYSGEHTIEQVLASRPICDPLTLLQCSPISDGAAALVVTSRRSSGRDVRVLGSVQRSGGPWDHRSEHVWGHEVVRDAAEELWGVVGLGPDDIDVAEMHDAFTIGELVTTEALGLAPVGESGALAVSGTTALGGMLPVNPSGGLLSKGHPLGATGVSQLAEITRQLRGEATGRQVDDARIGLVETMGGGVAGVGGNACVVALLDRPSEERRPVRARVSR